MKEIYIEIRLTISRHYPKNWLWELANISASECYLFPVLYVGYIEMQPQKMLCKVRKKKKKSENEKKLLAFQSKVMKDWFACA